MVTPVRQVEPDIDESVDTDRPWIVLVWNDPINLMSYVTMVFQKVFGYSLEKATALMLDVHHKGRAVVSNGTREKAELDVYRLHEHGLWATMQRDDDGARGHRARTRRSRCVAAPAAMLGVVCRPRSSDQCRRVGQPSWATFTTTSLACLLVKAWAMPATESRNRSAAAR